VDSWSVKEKEQWQVRVYLGGLLEEECPGVGLVGVGLIVEMSIAGVPLSPCGSLEEVGQQLHGVARLVPVPGPVLVLEVVILEGDP
jgi:hypothetical protein